MGIVKKFGKVLKNYVDCVTKLGFGDLFIRFIELVIIFGISYLVYYPVDLLKELLYKLLLLLFTSSTTFYQIFDLVIAIIRTLLIFFIFMYLFNKRYEDIDKLVARRGEKIYKYTNTNEQVDINKRPIIDEEIDLPKKAEKRKF